MKQSQIITKDSIAAKLFRIIFGIYITIAILVTCIQLGIEYYHVKNDVIEEVKSLQISFSSSLNEALWKFDEDQLNSLLKGIWENQVIIGVRIENHQKAGDIKTLGWVIDFNGDYHIINKENKEFPKIMEGVFFFELIEYEFPLKYVDKYKKEHDIGKGIFYSSNQLVIHRIKYGFILIVINSVVKTIALWVIFLLVVRRLLIRPLADLTQNVARIDPENVKQVDISIKTVGRNELKILEEVFTNMIQKLLSARKKIENHSLHLEEIVEKRTLELKKANKELQQKHNEQNAIFNAFPDLYFWLDSDSTIIGYHTGHKGDLYISPEAFLGKTIQDVLPPEIGMLFKKAADKIFLGEPSVSIEYKLNVPAGEKYFEARHSPLHENKIIIIVRDITKRKLMEENLRIAKHQAESANLAKSQFLTNMSHELRTPLNAILGFAQIIAHNPQIPTKEQDNLAIIQRSGNHLLTLINQVLDLSKIEAGKITLNENTFDLHRLLDDLKDMFSPRARQKGLRVSVNVAPDVPQNVRTDEVKLRQVLINILNNALKFTQAGKLTVQVTSSLQNSTARIQFDIEDTGAGIAPEEMNTLFKAFVQTETGKQAQEGTGLGLPISRKFAQLMGGDIKIASEAGCGTNVLIDIQAAVIDDTEVESPHPIRRAIALEPGQPKLRMLIVDDKPDNRALLFNILNRFGFELREAINGQESIDIWKEWRPHLIWMDLQMPVMGGYEAIEHIQSSVKHFQSHIQPVIIAVTARAFEEEREKAISKGCHGFLSKPFQEQAIFELLYKHLDVRFIYEDAETESKKAANIDRKALSQIPDDLLNSLKQDAFDANMDDVENIIEEIRKVNPELADGLYALAYDFEYGKIVQIIEETLKSDC
ncbi:ATP-binding protein [Desulfococcaceae bacterium HSG7]|nr:ATP-binding protein [Desulfococcaceae bacterium HSG7]